MQIDRKVWASLLQDLRRFFDGRGYLEVTTDHLVGSGAVESNLDTFRVTGQSSRYELHTSPEIAMKEALAEEKTSLYQICRCFRDDPTSPIHRPEFTMLEWYRLGAKMEHVVDETLALIETVAALSPLAAPVHRVSCRDAIFAKTGIDIGNLTDRNALYDAVQRDGRCHVSETDSWEDLFFRLLLDFVERSFDPSAITVLDGYPTRVSPLARADEQNPFFAKRFEIFWRGMELCNGCEELDDPQELRVRLEKENETRRREGKPPHASPETLWRAFDKGFPPCSGVALGVERLALGLTLVRKW